MTRGAAVIVVGLVAAASAFAAPSAQPTLRAHLKPVAPTTRASGTFTASATGADSIVLRWQLSLSNVRSPKSATLKILGPPSFSLRLCGPCSTKGRGRLVILGPVWRRILEHGGSVVVATAAQPNGALRGPLTHT